MKSNIEIKAKVNNLEKIKKSVKQISQPDPQIFDQRDIFYKVQNGRLKLRTFSVNDGELI